MYLKNIQIRSFRNLSNVKIDFDFKTHLFTGSNAQGKTSVLEAIYYLSDLSSFRDVDPSQLIQKGKDQTSLWVDLEEENYLTKLEAHLAFDVPSDKVSRIAKINEDIFRSRNHYLKEKLKNAARGFHSIIFMPSSMQIIYGAPSLRRKYLNRTLSAEDPDYFTSLMRFERLCEQKAKYLKSYAPPDLWDAIHDQWIDLASEISFKRLNWAKKINAPLQNSLSTIAPSQPEVALEYEFKSIRNQSDLSQLNTALNRGKFSLQCEGPSLQDLKTIYREEIKNIFALEKQRGFLLVGPQRDDFKLLSGKSEQRDLKDIGSQGEVRSALLALKISEIQSYRDASGLRPILLVDDFSSELDIKRREAILAYLLATDLQTFVTTTEEFSRVGRTFKVIQGTVHESNYGNTNRSEQTRLPSG